MKWAVYIDNPDEELVCAFFKTEEEARQHIQYVIKNCEIDSENEERNLFWDITLLEVKGEVGWGPNGLALVSK